MLSLPGSLLGKWERYLSTVGSGVILQGAIGGGPIKIKRKNKQKQMCLRPGPQLTDKSYAPELGLAS